MLKILVVDDDVTVTQLLQVLLKMEGHQATPLNDSTATLTMVEKLNPDLILLDLMMPGLTGFEICELLRQNPKYSEIPVMIVSALDDRESREKALNAGAKDYMTKPFNVDTLTQKIKELTNLS